MKSVIILTASTGAGHNQAANNLKQSFEEKGIYCHIIDMFKVTNKSMNFLIANGYKFFAEKMPSVYGTMYKFSDQKQINNLMLNNAFLLTEGRLKWLVNELKPDLLISTHPFGAPIVGKLKKKGDIDVPLIQIVTDFIAHYTYVHTGIDAYIVASDSTMQSLVEKGANKSKIYVFGIPIKEEFRHRKKREFKSDRPLNLLIMGGSMGLAPMKDAVDALVATDKDLTMSIVCGTNKNFYNEFNQRYAEKIAEGKVKIYGFVDNIAQLMDESDLIISKPGGLTTTEAIHKCIPMIIPFAIPGQERENTNFLLENNMAIEVHNVQKLDEYISNLIIHPEQYQNMVDNMEKLSAKYSIDEIIDLAVSLMI